MSTFEIFRKNQLLFLEAGFVHVNALVSGFFVPLWGATFLFVSVSTYFTLCFMSAIIEQPEDTFEDFINVIRSGGYPSAVKNAIAVLCSLLATVPILMYYNMDLLPYPVSSGICTVIASSIGAFAFLIATGNWQKLGSAISFCLLGLPVMCLSLFLGGVLSLPLLFIFLYKRF